MTFWDDIGFSTDDDLVVGCQHLDCSNVVKLRCGPTRLAVRHWTDSAARVQDLRLSTCTGLSMTCNKKNCRLSPCTELGARHISHQLPVGPCLCFACARRWEITVRSGMQCMLFVNMQALPGTAACAHQSCRTCCATAICDWPVVDHALSRRQPSSSEYALHACSLLYRKSISETHASPVAAFFPTANRHWSTIAPRFHQLIRHDVRS